MRYIMKSYQEMSNDDLLALKAELEAQYKAFQGKGITAT